MVNKNKLPPTELQCQRKSIVDFPNLSSIVFPSPQVFYCDRRQAAGMDQLWDNSSSCIQNNGGETQSLLPYKASQLSHISLFTVGLTFWWKSIILQYYVMSHYNGWWTLSVTSEATKSIAIYLSNGKIWLLAWCYAMVVTIN